MIENSQTPHLGILTVLAVTAVFVHVVTAQPADLCKAHGKGQSLLQRHDTFRKTLVYPSKQSPPGLKCDEKLNAEAAKYARAYASSPGDALQAAYQEQRPDVWENRFSARLSSADAKKFDAQAQERLAADAFGQWICYPPQKAELGPEFTQAAWFHNIEMGMAVEMNKDQTKYAVVALYRFKPAPAKDPENKDPKYAKQVESEIKAYYTNALSNGRQKADQERGSKSASSPPDLCAAEEKEDERLHQEFTAGEPKSTNAGSGAKLGLAAISSAFSQISDFIGGKSLGGGAVSIGNGQEGGLGAAGSPAPNPAAQQVKAMNDEAAYQLQYIDYYVNENQGKPLLDQYVSGALKKKGDDFVAEAARVARAVQIIAMDFCFANHPGEFADINQEAMCFKKMHNKAQIQAFMTCTDDLLVKTHKLAGIVVGDPAVPVNYDHMLKENHVYQTMTVLYDRYCHYHEYSIADEARRAFEMQLMYKIPQQPGAATAEDRGLEFQKRWRVVRDSVENDARRIWETGKYLSDFENGMRIHSVESKLLDLCMLDNPVIKYDEKNLKEVICEGKEAENDDLESLMKCANTWANRFARAWRELPFVWDRVTKVNKADAQTPIDLAAIGKDQKSKPSFVRALTVRFCGRQLKDTVFTPIVEAVEKQTPQGKQPNKNLVRSLVMQAIEARTTNADVAKIQAKVAEKVAKITATTDTLEADIKELAKKNEEFAVHHQTEIDELRPEIKQLEGMLRRLAELAKALELAKVTSKVGEIKEQADKAKKVKEALEKSLHGFEEEDAKSEFVRRKHANKIVRKAFEYCHVSHKEGLTMVTAYDVCEEKTITTDLLELLDCTRRIATGVGNVERVMGNYNYGYAFSKFFCWNDPLTKFFAYITFRGTRAYRLKQYEQLSQGLDAKYGQFIRNLETIADYRSLEKQGKFDQHYVPVKAKVPNRGSEV